MFSVYYWLFSSFFQSHPKVSQNLRKKFQVFHKRWLKENVDEEQEKHCKNWLLGRTEDNIPTSCIRVDNPSKPPYTPYNRYKVLEKTWKVNILLRMPWTVLNSNWYASNEWPLKEIAGKFHFYYNHGHMTSAMCPYVSFDSILFKNNIQVLFIIFHVIAFETFLS